jgi:hypothetical protein
MPPWRSLPRSSAPVTRTPPKRYPAGSVRYTSYSSLATTSLRPVSESPPQVTFSRSGPPQLTWRFVATTCGCATRSRMQNTCTWYRLSMGPGTNPERNAPSRRFDQNSNTRYRAAGSSPRSAKRSIAVSAPPPAVRASTDQCSNGRLTSSRYRGTVSRLSASNTRGPDPLTSVAARATSADREGSTS